MFKKLAISTALSLALVPAAAFAAGGSEQHIEDVDFSFEGPFGVFDQNQLQRGLQIYTEVCSACHGLKYVPLRTLADEGGPEAGFRRLSGTRRPPFGSRGSGRPSVERPQP